MTTTENWIETKLASLSLREKLGQMLVPMLTKHSVLPLPLDEWIDKYKVGGGHVFGGKMEKVKSFIDAAQAASDIPLLISGDLDKGCGDRISEGTYFLSSSYLSLTILIVAALSVPTTLTVLLSPAEQTPSHMITNLTVLELPFDRLIMSPSKGFRSVSIK